MNQNEESREFTRLNIPVSVSITTLEGEILDQRALNISMKGVLIPASDSLPIGSQSEVKIILGDENPLIIVSRGKVVRSDAHGVAIDFLEMDISSFPHMKNLILYNAQESDQIAEEFVTHTGLHKKST